MVILPGQCIYVFTPRTASRATEKALMEVPGASMYDRAVHHDDPSTIPDISLPVYATIRDPYRQVLSWYWNWRDRMTPQEFLKSAPPGRPWVRSRLNVYDEWVDGYFVYERGLDRIFEFLGYPDIEIPKIGVSGVEPDWVDKEFRLAVDEALPYDVDLYERVMKGERRLG